MAPPTRRFTLTLLAVGSLMAAAGCSGDDDSAGDTLATIATPTTPPTTTPVTAAPTTEPPTTLPPTTEETTTTSTTSTTVAPSTTATPATTTTVPPTTVAPAARPVPGPTGLGVVELGAPADATIAALTAAFGAPTEDTGWVDAGAISGCGGTEGRRVDWGVLSVVLGEQPGAPAGARQFVAYSYGSVSEIGGEPKGLTTAEGIGLGSSVADLQAAYPGVQVFAGEEGLLEPAFAISEGFTGLLTSEAPDGAVTVISGGPCE